MRNKMDGFRVDGDDDDDKEAAGKKGNSNFGSCHQDHDAKHRRSKSASDRKSNISRGGILRHPKDQTEIHASPLSSKAFRACSPLHEHPAYISKNASSNNRASLENDIEQLQLRLQQEKSMRMMLERTMGRVSSTLSPGHRHFSSQTKELISEIEQLEEEVANREQHVLTLYRSIFEHCVSQPPSQQSSSVASPAHAKHALRKHPSLISSAFCSSKKSALSPLHALISINDLSKRISKTQDAPQFLQKNDVSFSDPVKANKKVQEVEKTPMVRTLKDHLNQCPSKLSEEMVRCMAAVYCWLSSAAAVSPKKKRSPLLSRSSTNVILPRRGIGSNRDWSCKSMVEISCISTDTGQFSRAAFAINSYRFLVEQLERVGVNQMGNNAQIAFWINVYNSLVMHAYLAYGIPQSPLRRLSLFNKAAYNIGGQIISANAIEQSILCFRTPRNGRWLETIISAAWRKKTAEQRQHISSLFGFPNSEPLLCFALCTGAFSDPALRVYSATNIKEELEAAKREFLQANVVVKNSRKVFLPKILERFAREASINSDDLLKWVTANVDRKLHDSIQKCTALKPTKKPSQIVDWLPYSSRFQYVLSKDLTEKPLSKLST